MCEDKKCTGCLACINICNSGALSVTTNDEGYYRPLLNSEKCIMCGLCESACPVITPVIKQDEKKLKVYAAWHKDASIRRRSSSGGAFSALAESVLHQGGVVFGAAYTEDLHVQHIEVTDEEGLERLRLSKYAQSCVGGTMKRVRELLREGRLVMFVGTPCQVAGLKNFLRKDYDNLLLVDFICHGVPSNDMLQAYLHWLEKKYGKVNHINFRDKRKGWYDALRVIKTDRGGDTVLKGDDDNYWVGFNNNNNLQQSCYQCVAQGFPRVSDITLADFWQIGLKIPFGHKNEIEKGVSLLAINSDKGAKALRSSVDSMFIEERSIEEGIAGNVAAIRSSICPDSRETIYRDLKNMNYDDFRKKYYKTNIKQDAVKFFREYLPYGVIKRIRLSKQR